MAKDPAFLFYPGDWLGGTMSFTFEEKGAYLELLLLQFNYGSFTEEMAEKLVGKLWPFLKVKFEEKNGKFFNKKLQKEIKRRKEYSESRRKNRKMSKLGAKTYDKDMNNICETSVEHMETETETGTDTITDTVSWKNDFNIYLCECQNAYNDLLSDSDWIAEQEKFYPNVDILLSLEKSFKQFWGTEAGWMNKKRKRSKSINWKSTFQNTFGFKSNLVYKQKNQGEWRMFPND